MKISKEFKIGLTVIITIALFVWGFNFLKGKNVFKNATFYYAVYNDISGLKDANTVYLRGFKVGQVSNISIMDDSSKSILVELFVEEELDIPVNSCAIIISDGYMGIKAIDLILSDSSAICKSNDTLIGMIEEGILDQLEPTKNKIDSVLISLKYIFDRQSQENIKQSLENIEGFTNALNENSDRFNTIMKDIESITYNIKNYNKEITNLLTNLSDISDTLAQSEVKQTFAKANAVMQQTHDMLIKINNGEGSVGLLVNNDTLYQNLESAAKNLDKLVIDLKENPKRYVHFSVFGNKEKKK